ncbi:hypothetical protein RJO02_003381 [Enterobacter hormaechei]|uniref:hypothetical protein n=1 Tax=Enterobacter hormaechei TaxID=158836 RepID=UPI00286211E0|nr:hypothetical protein [Enterobacter hormaechei]
MTEAKTKPYAPRVVSEGDIPVHKTLGEVAQTRNVGIPRPIPDVKGYTGWEHMQCNMDAGK